MRARDSLAPELAAWKKFAAPVLDDPQSDLGLLAQTHFGLGIAHYYAKQYEAGWAEIEAPQTLGAQPLVPLRRGSAFSWRVFIDRTWPDG